LKRQTSWFSKTLVEKGNPGNSCNLIQLSCVWMKKVGVEKYGFVWLDEKPRK